MNAKQEIRSLLQTAVNDLSNNYNGSSLTDIFILIDDACGELSVYDDEENSVAKGIIADWENNAGKDIDYVGQLRAVVNKMNDDGCFQSLELYTPFSINLADEEFVVTEELLLITDDSVVHLEDDFMKRMDQEFDDFLNKLMKD